MIQVSSISTYHEVYVSYEDAMDPFPSLSLGEVSSKKAMDALCLERERTYDAIDQIYARLHVRPVKNLKFKFI